MDETYVRVKRKWTYLYRAIHKQVQTLDCILSERRDEAAAASFFSKTIARNSWPNKVIIDKSGSNTAGLLNMNCRLVMNSWCWLIDGLQVKYRNNIIEQDHRFTKRITRPMQTFKPFNRAKATLADIEVAHMIRKGQFDRSEPPGFAQFAKLAG